MTNINTFQGDVGVGTNSPANSLHVYKAAAEETSGLLIEKANDGIPTCAALFFGVNAASENPGVAKAAIFYERNLVNGRGDIKFCNDSVNDANPVSTAAADTRMIIKNDGNVGIGTMSPACALDIAGEDVMIRGNTPSLNFSEVLNSSAMDGAFRIRYDGYNQADNNNFLAIQTGSSFGITSLHCKYDGNVGIGTTVPYAKLHVWGNSGNFTTAGTSPSRASYFINNSGLYINTTANFASATIYGSNDIIAGGFVASFIGTINASDTRIKTEIVDVEDGSALETLRLLKPKKYKYIDKVKQGTEPVWGFIAQEVRDTLPYASQLRRECVPNIYELANVSASNVITFSNFDTSNLESNAMVLKVFDKDDMEHLVNITEVVDDHSVRVEEDLSEWTGSIDESGNVVAGNQLFVYGQQVDDFVFLKKDAIWTCATAALQEVDRQLQAEKAKVITLETQLTSVLTRLDALEGA